VILESEFHYAGRRWLALLEIPVGGDVQGAPTVAIREWVTRPTQGGPRDILLACAVAVWPEAPAQSADGQAEDKARHMLDGPGLRDEDLEILPLEPPIQVPAGLGPAATAALCRRRERAAWLEDPKERPPGQPGIGLERLLDGPQVSRPAEPSGGVS
jgi:hypothetical protein